MEFKEQIKNAVLNYLNEGPRTGDSPTQTMAMGGRFMRRLKKSVDSGETGQDVLDSKKAQANRINRKVADRQANYATSHGYDPKSVEKVRTQSKRRGSDSYYKGQGNPHKIPGLDDPSMERAPANAPNPTDVRRRAKGQEAYPRRTMQASEQIKNAVLNYLDEWTAEGVMKAAEKRGERDIYDEDGNIIDVTSKSDKARTTTVTKDPKTGEVVVDRHDKTNKPPRTTTDKLAKGEKLTPAEAATADRRRNRSVSDSRNKRVIKP